MKIKIKTGQVVFIKAVFFKERMSRAASPDGSLSEAVQVNRLPLEKQITFGHHTCTVDHGSQRKTM